MKQNTNNTKKKNEDYASIRVKSDTKQDINKFLEKINKTEDCGKITFDALVTYFLKNVSSDDIKNLQKGAITWAHEDRRLKRLWEKKKGKVSEVEWKQLLYMGQLASFIAENSRLEVSTTI